MTRRQRNLAIALVLPVLAASEVAYRALRVPVASVELVNEGDEPVEGLEVRCGSDVERVARIHPGESARVNMSGRGKQTLSVKFRQKGNAMTGFDVVGFDPAALERERFKLMLKIRPNEYERYQEEGDPSTLSTFAERARGWLQRSLEAY